MKLTKVIVASLTVPSVVVPLTTLTSCSQGWGHATPMAIGSLGNGPYSKLSGEYLDRDGDVMAGQTGYLQQSYAIQKSSNAYYGYSSPMKFVQSEEEKTPGEWKLGEVGWYTSTDNNLNPYAKDKVEDPETKYTRTSARNAALSQNIDFVSSIGLTISSYVDMALSYSVSQVQKSYNECEDDIQAAWGGGINHGKKGGTSSAEIEQNNQFYEFMFALANNLETTDGKNIAMLQTSNTNFGFGTMPIPSYKFESTDRKDLSDNFKATLEGADWTNKSYFTKKSDIREEKNPDPDKDPFKYISYTYESVPIIIHTVDYKKTFVNVSKKANSFLINDYYSTDSEVTKTVGNQWKSGKRRPGLQAFTDIKDEDAKPKYKEYVMTSNTDQTPITCQDDRLPSGQIHRNDFIALVNYTVNLYDQTEGIEEGHPDRNSAIINRLDYMFPAYFLELYEDIYKDVKEDGPKIFDKKKIDKHNKDLMKLLERSSKDGKKAHAKDVSEDGKKLLQFLQKMFGTNTSTFLIPGQEIQK